MIKNPTLPMLPGALPQQRLHTVVDLIPRPESFQGRVDWLDEMPDELRPKGSPRKVEYLGQTEWAWAPMHSRIDAYYLSSRGRYWLLWDRYFDENQEPWRWVWNLYAYGLKKGVTAREAAIYLLMDAWGGEKQEVDLDCFHWINETGSLSVSDFVAIARTVWPEHFSEEVV